MAGILLLQQQVLYRNQDWVYREGHRPPMIILNKKYNENVNLFIILYT